MLAIFFSPSVSLEEDTEVYLHQRPFEATLMGVDSVN